MSDGRPPARPRRLWLTLAGVLIAVIAGLWLFASLAAPPY